MDNENKIKASVSEAEESKAAETADNANENAAVKPAENEAVKTVENETSAETGAAENKSWADENEEPVKEEPPKNRRNTKWFIGAFIAMFLVFIMPLVTIGVVTFALPPVYDNTFIGELGEKYDRLKSIDEPKIVIIGGSSVAFGIDSKLMEEKLGMKVVNFGLYANLGTKLMIDLSKANINEGDIIILAPEMSEQTLSLYFNAETFMQALDGNPSMLLNVDTDNYEAIVGASWKFAYEKLNYLRTGTRPENAGAYKKENFNEYGDNVFDRPYNEMTQTTNVINLTFRTNYEDDKETKYEEYIDYVNDYIKFANRKGATVYYSLCPMNAAALGEKNNADVIYDYYRNLVKSLNCKVISNVNDYLMDEGYFFDSEFHLNNAGVTVRTVKLIDDIKRERDIFTQTMPSSELPAPPGFKPADKAEGGLEENPYFIVAEIQGKTEVYYKITGITEEGKKQTTLTIPNNIKNENGEFLPVRTLATDALLGCTALKELIIGENITAIEGRALNGARALEKLVIPDIPDDFDFVKEDPANIINVPNKTSEYLITEDEDKNDACPNLKIYVDADAYLYYVGNYFWDSYGTKIVAKTQ